MELTVFHVLNSGTHVSGLGLPRGVSAQLGQTPHWFFTLVTEETFLDALLLLYSYKTI